MTKKSKEVLTQDLKQKMRPVDYLWGFLIVVFCGLTAVYSLEVVNAIKEQRNVKNYKPEEFGVFSYE